MIGSKLYVGNLPESITEDELIEEFSKYGHILSVDIFQDKKCKNTCFAFIEIKDRDDAISTEVILNNTEWKRRNITVLKTRTRYRRIIRKDSRKPKDVTDII